MKFLITAANGEGERSWIDEFPDEASARAGVAARGYRVARILPMEGNDLSAAHRSQAPERPGAWYACLIAMWLCIAGALFAAFQAMPAPYSAYESAQRILAGLPVQSRSWNVLLLVAAGNSLLGAVIFGALAAIVRRVDELTRRST